MLGDIRQAQKVYIVCGYTDMRKGLNSLVPFVQQNFGIDPYSSSLFLFCGKRCDRLKALLWEPDGFVLLYKRLDNGRYQWPRNAQEVKPLTWEQFTWLMHVPFPVSWTVKMKKKQKETQDILSYHTQAAGCSDKARAKASGGRQPIEECGRTGL